MDIADELSLLNLSTPPPPPEKQVDDCVVDEPSPIRQHYVVNQAKDVSRFEKVDDCFILGLEPNEEKQVDTAAAGSPDIVVVAEKGQVACRDYPHPRHLCVKFPFQTTTHDKYCELCYCYVCDTAAPCKSWTSSSMSCWGWCELFLIFLSWALKIKFYRNESITQ